MYKSCSSDIVTESASCNTRNENNLRSCKMIENGEIAVKTVVLSKDRRKVIRGNPNYVFKI